MEDNHFNTPCQGHDANLGYRNECFDDVLERR
jgi:hypothetical protein